MRWRLSDRAARNGMTAMGSFSIWHWMLFGAVALLLFGGKGKISDLMGDVAKGVKSFKKGLADDDDEPAVAEMSRPQRPPSRPDRSRAGSASTRTTFTRSADLLQRHVRRPEWRRALLTPVGARPVSHVRS